MKTMWKEKYIGEIIGGYLEDSFIYIYDTDNVAVVNNRKIICYINGDTVTGYENKSQSQTKKIGSSLAGNLLFGTAGALSFGNQTNYILEIIWNNHEKSLVKIEGEQFYNFFISKLYEKTPIKKKSNEEKLLEKITECNQALKNEQISSAVEKLIRTIPYYKFAFQQCDMVEFDDKISQFTSDSKNYLQFLTRFDGDAYNHTYIEKSHAIQRLKMIKSGNIFAQKLYENDAFLKTITDEEYKKYEKYEPDELDEILKKEEQENIYQRQKSEHEKNGYLFFSNDIHKLKEQLEDIKDKLPHEIQVFLLKIVEECPIQSEGLYQASSYYIVSKIVNAFFGKHGLTKYGHDGGLLQVVTISPAVKKHLDQLIEIGDNKKRENEYFESLDVDEYDAYFQANDIYMAKYIMEENIEVRVEKEGK